jgi:hypothetical protein
MGGGGGGDAPKAPPFHPLKIGNITQAALTKDIDWYKSLQYPVFPGMTDLRQGEIEDAYKQLTSPLAPEYQSTFMKAALGKSEAVTGGGDPFSAMGMTKGSFAKGGVAADVTRSALAKQDYDRTRFDTLMSQNGIPGLGLSQQDILALYTYNTNAQNASNMANYQTGIANANADYAAQAQMWNTIGSTVSGLGSVYGNYARYNAGMNAGAPIDYGLGG